MYYSGIVIIGLLKFVIFLYIKMTKYQEIKDTHLFKIVGPFQYIYE